MAKNILVNGKNNITAQRRANAMADIQASMANSTSATNVNTTPNLPTSITRPERTINLQKAQQPVNTKLENLNQATGKITGNNPAFYNGQLISQNNQPSRFIGFQQNNNFGNTVLTKPATEQQGKSWGNVINGKYVYIPTAEGAAKSYNFKEENRFKDQETALLDLQGDLYKRGKILSESEIKRLYPEFADQMDAIMEFQNEILPIVKEGKGVSGEQISQLYNELIQPKNLQDVDKIKKKTNTETKNRQTLENSIDKALKTNWESLSADGLKYLKNADYLLKVKNAVKEKGVVGGASDSEIIKYLLNNNTELKDLLKEMNSLNLTDKDRAILGQKSSNILSLISANLGSDLITATGQENEFRPTDEEIDTAIKGKEALEKDFWGETWKNIKTKASIPLDSWEKFVYRIGTDLKNANLDAKDYIAKNFPKSVAEQFLGTKLTDDTYNYLVDRIVSFDEERKKINQQSVDDYNRLVNEDYQRKVNENLNPDIEKYINNRSMTRSLLDMDLKGFAYKAAGESASNWEMPLIIGAGAVSSGVGFALMATDSFARENQEAYEELREAGADYEQAREGATIVGLASSAVEVGLEKLLGGVETTASKAIKDIITKDFTKKATEMVAEKGLVELLKNGAVTQFRSSFEEGLEEVLQQVIHNTAIQKYDPNQEITQGLLESFEGGFFNPMNLLAGGGEIFDNISENADYFKQNAYETAYNLGQKTRQVTDKVDNTLNKGAYNAGRGARIVTDAVENAKNKITSQGKTDNTQQQEQGKIVNTTSENQNNINGDNYSQKNKNNKTLNKVQLGMLQNDNRMNPTKITEFKEKFGKDYGQALADMGYTESQETNVPKIEEDTKEIYNEKKKAMNSVQGEFQDRSLADMLEIMLQKAKNTKDYEMIDKYEKLTEKHNTKGLTMAEANDMREEFSYKIKTRWNTENNSDKIDLANNVYTAVRKFLEDTAEANGISDLQEMNREIAMRKYLSTWIGDKAERQSANNMVSLTDWIMLAEAASNPYAAAGLAVKKIVQTPTVKNAVLNAVVGRRENRAIDKQNRQAENKKRMENIESANEGKRLQEELSKSETPALPNGIKLTKVTEIDARKPKNKVTKKNNKSDNNKKSDSSSSDDTTPPTGGTPTGTNPTNNQGGTPTTDDTKNAVTKKQPKKKAETTTKQENKQARKPREDQTRTELLYGDLEELGAKVEDTDGNLTPIADVADKFTDYVHRVGMEKSKGEYDARNIAKAIKEYFDNHKIDDFYKKEVLRDDGVYRVEISDEALTDILNRTIELETGTKGDKKVHQITGKVTQGIIEEERKNKVTAKKTEATAPKQEKNQTKKFTYDEYGQVMNKIGEVEKKINDKLDKQYEQERAEKMSRFEELRDKEDKTDAEGKELVKLQGELNNMTNKYDKLKEDELKKQAPELLKQKEELQQAFDRDWKAMMDRKMQEMRGGEKKELTAKEKDGAREKALAKPDGTLIYTNGEFKYIPSLQQGLIRMTREEGEIKLREQIESAFSDPRYSINVWVDDEGNGYVYNEGRWDLDELENKTADEVIIDKDNYKGYDIMRDGSTIEFELDPETSDYHYIQIDLQDFLNNSDLSKRVESKPQNKGTSTDKNKITNTKSIEMDYFEDIDPQTLKILKDKGDKMAIDLYNEMTAEDKALMDLYDEITAEDTDRRFKSNLSENETPQDIDYQDLAELENETPQMLEEESTNKVTSNGKNKVTNGGTNLDKAIEIIKNADATKPQQGYIGEDTYARVSSSDVVIKTKGDSDFNQVSFYRKAVSLSEMAQNDTMFIVLNDAGEKGIENVNKVLEGFDLQYRVGSELDNRGYTVYYLENTNTGHKDYFSDEGRSEPALSKTLRDKTIVPRFTPEQQAEYDRQMEQRRKEQEAEREKERQEEEKRKEEEAKRLEEENTRKANLLTYVNDTYGDNPLQRGRVLKELSELNEESDHKIRYYGDEVPDNAEVWQVLDALADLNGSFSETRESGDNYTWTYNYGDNRSINRLTKAQKNYLEYRINIKPVQNRLQNYLDNIENKSLRTRTENVLNKKDRWELDDGKIVTWTKAQYIEWLVNDLGYRPKEFPTGKTYANGEPKIDYMIVNEKNAGYISSKIENGYAKSLLEAPEEELSAEDEAKLDKELFNKKSDNSDYESRIIKDNSNYKFEDLKDADIETILSKDGFEKYTFEEDGQKGEGYAGYINGKAVDIIPNKEKNRITINVGDELFRSYDDGSINVQLNGSDEITQTSSVYDNEAFKGTLARALGTEYKALGEPKSYKYDKDNGVFAIYDKSDSDKILYEVSLGDKVMFDDGTIYDTSKHLGAGRTQAGEKHFDNKPVTEIFAGKTLIGISKGNKYASNKYTDTRAQGAVLKDMESIQELEWLLEDKNNILVGEIDGTPVKVSALDLNYNPIKMENVGKEDDYYNKVKTYKLQVGKNTDNTYFYDTFPELKSALKRIYVGEDVNKTTTEITGEKNAVTAKIVENEKPKNLVTSRIEDTKQEIQEIDKDTYFDDIVKNLKDHPREMFIYKDGNYFYPHYILPSGKVITPENTYWGEVSSEEAARNWLLKEAEEHTEENETKKAEKLKEIVGKTAEKYEATLKRIESDNPMQEIWTSGDYFKYGMGNNQMARAKKESEANAEVGTFKKDVIDGKEGYRIFVAGTKNEAIRAFYEPKTGKTYRIYRGPIIDDSKPYTTKQVERIEKFLQNVDKQLDKETKKEKKEEKQVITQEWLDSLKPDKDGVIELDYKGDERWALGKGKEALIKEGKADGKYLYNYGGEAHPQYMAIYIKNGIVYEGRKGLEDQYMTTKQEAVDWLNQKEKDVEHESTERYTQTDYETLPKTISVESEAEKAGPKRIAPDRVKRQQETYDQGLENVKNVLKQSPVKIYELGFKSDRSKAVQNILEERKRIRQLPETEAEKQWNELAKSVYEDLVIKDISKGYRYPEDVTSKFPKAQMKKAVDARARYEKGLFTSFSAKDTRANNQYRDEIGAGIKSQDGKPVTQEQMNEIVDGIRAYSNIFGVDMKKFAEDNNVIYVHLHGGNPFLMGGMSIAGLYRRDAAGNISVSLGGREGVMEKGEDGKMKKSDIKTTTVHEITHAVDGMLEGKLFSDADTEILKKTMNKPSELINYYNRKQEIVARAVEQYAAHQLGKKLYRTALANIDWENGNVEFVEKEANYVDREAYWNQENFDKYVKPIVEKNMKEKMKDYMLENTRKNVLANDKNKITSKPKKVESNVDAETMDALRSHIKKLTEVGDLLQKGGLTEDEKLELQIQRDTEDRAIRKIILNSDDMNATINAIGKIDQGLGFRYDELRPI